jgi:hypothetical protein
MLRQGTGFSLVVRRDNDRLESYIPNSNSKRSYTPICFIVLHINSDLLT